VHETVSQALDHEIEASSPFPVLVLDACLWVDRLSPFLFASRLVRGRVEFLPRALRSVGL